MQCLGSLFQHSVIPLRELPMTKFRRTRSKPGRGQKAAGQAFAESVQPKLKMGAPGDQYEREADHVADKVVDPSVPVVSTQSHSVQPVQRQFLHRQEEKQEPAQAKFIQRQGQQEEDKMQRKEEQEEPVQTKFLQAQEEKEEPAQAKMIQAQAEEKEEAQAKLIQREAKEEEAVQSKEEMEEPAQAKLIQRLPESETLKTSRSSGSKFAQKKGSSDKESKANPSFDFEAQLEKTKAGGKPLDEETRAFMEKRMGYNFSAVRIHTGPDAVQLARHIHAQAFTVGNHVFFNAGKYKPDTEDGLKLLAHELTHVIQQGK